uniref:Uncharacterized protein n=1 Tax=Timema genevievae TaxID=629358 RepID=A0A7R9K6N5_TIMGE|nr:unnamed protein product [Timema genevievae]
MFLDSGVIGEENVQHTYEQRQWNSVVLHRTSESYRSFPRLCIGPHLIGHFKYQQMLTGGCGQYKQTPGPSLVRAATGEEGFTPLFNLQSTYRNPILSSFREVKEGFGNQINLCQDLGLNPGPPAQKSDTLTPDHQVTQRVIEYN